ncbi:DUF4442 domain-containing protein [Flavicella sp.]|uniref:DUF4442 domain-containing protein n=1 Tax=Flavicella sp. TaxID=2957742 RepID=UPI00260EDE5A|nr:DUF4442 domain-containing protein [Flavicella sp.]MDG1806042.1 DUF4442 domain-containing protein [Flavicella sp.]
MKFTAAILNRFVFFKIPSAYLSGVRVDSVSEDKITVRVRSQWINQNPFKSMYWATQGMASELATGVLMMRKIYSSKKKISMLVVGQKGEFLKKATGVIYFDCLDDGQIQKAIDTAVQTGEGQQLVLQSNGVDEQGDIVSKFEYEWGIKLKQ